MLGQGEDRSGDRILGGRRGTFLLLQSSPSRLHLNKTQEIPVTEQFEKLCSPCGPGGDLVNPHLDALWQSQEVQGQDLTFLS